MHGHLAYEKSDFEVVVDVAPLCPLSDEDVEVILVSSISSTPHALILWYSWRLPGVRTMSALETQLHSRVSAAYVTSTVVFSDQVSV